MIYFLAGIKYFLFLFAEFVVNYELELMTLVLKRDPRTVHPHFMRGI